MTDDSNRELASAVNPTSPMDTHEGLLACPFCGYPPCYRFAPNQNGDKYPWHHKIWCDALSCDVGVEVIEVDLAEATRIWNRRAIPAPAQAAPCRGALTMIATECHRAKWEFDINDEEPPKAAAARVLVDLAFKTLHRIGDMALKLRDGSALSSTHREYCEHGERAYCTICHMWSRLSRPHRGGAA